MQAVWQADDRDPSAVLQLISQRARILTRSSGAAIALAHKGSMICRASVGNAPTLGSRVDVSTGFSAECVRTGLVLRCDNTESDPRVDVESCRRRNVHSILAAPIRLGGEVVGLLEVFSPQPYAFHDSDLAVIEHLAETVLVAPFPSKTTPARTPDPPRPKRTPPKPPKLLLELEPAYRVFFGNLIDLLHPPQTVPLNLTSRPARFWPDVLVPSEIPWDRFGQSMLLHLIMVAVLALIEFGLSQRPVLRQARLAFNQSDVLYYSPWEYPRSVNKGSGLSRSAKARPPAVIRQPVISVPRDPRRPTQASMAPPKLPLKGDLRLLKIIAVNPSVPAVPFSATTGNLPRTPGASVAVVAPPPDVSAVSRTKQPTLQTPAVIEPAPSVDPSIRQTANLGLGHLQAVRPAPETRVPELSSLSMKAPATLGRTTTSVVPPPPSVTGVGNSGQRASSRPDATPQVVPPAPWFERRTGYLNNIPEVRSIIIVPPAPSVHGLGHSGGQTMSSLAGAGTQVVPPAPQLQNAGTYARGSGSGLAVAAVPPSPTVGSLGQPGGRGVSSLGAAGTQVVPPAPQLQNAGTYARGGGSGLAVAAVPPPPTVGSLGQPGGRGVSSLRATGTQVVPPAPQLQNGGTYARSGGSGLAVAAVPPPPTVGSLGQPGGRGVSSLRATGTQVVPPAPQLQNGGTYARGGGGGLAVAAVPPPPSVRSLGPPGGRGGSSLRPSATQVAPPPIAARNGGDRTRGGGQTIEADGLPGGLLPGEISNSGGETSADPNELSSARELNVNFIGPALVLPSSSYFASCEVFIAEEQLTRHQSRLIKLVYDFLPYQPRLSDLGPNYPTIENLRATRDPSCDEPLREVVSSANTGGWPRAARLQLNAKSSQQRQSTLACYRTTADDYRRARARQHR